MSGDSEEFMEQIQEMEKKEEMVHKRNKRNFIIWMFCILFFAFLSCLSIYFIAIDYNRELFIPALFVCGTLVIISIFHAVQYGRKYYYRQRDVGIVRRDRSRVRVPLDPQNEEFGEESGSTSSPDDLTDPAAGPSNLPQTESSTLSEQTSTQESNEKTSLSDSTKGTFTTTAVIERLAAASGPSGDAQSAAEEEIAGKTGDEGPGPSTSPQTDSADSLAVDADPEGEIVKVRHRRPTPD